MTTPKTTPKPSPTGSTPALSIHAETRRPLWGNRVVPYITRWSTETPDLNPWLTFAEINGRLWLGVGKSNSHQDVLAQRDSLNLLWRNDPIRPGQGYPLFAEVHALRQRRCQVRGLCQVCAKPFPAKSPYTFLETQDMTLPDSSRQLIGGGVPGFYTFNPPTCAGCIELAMAQCPAQARHDRVVIHAMRTDLIAVRADIYDPHTATPTAVDQVLTLDNPLTQRAMVKQIAIGIEDWTETPLP